MNGFDKLAERQSSLTLQRGLILISALAVVFDALLLPYYPAYFELQFGQTASRSVGDYLASLCAIALVSLPLWACIAKRFGTLRLLGYTQLATALLTAACGMATDEALFWLCSLCMVFFKTSYLLIYPLLLQITPVKSHRGTIGLLTVIVHGGALIGASIGAASLHFFPAAWVWGIMTLGDVVQWLVLIGLMATLRKALPGPAVLPTTEPSQAETLVAPTGLFTGLLKAGLLPLGLLALGIYAIEYLPVPFIVSHWQQITQNPGAVSTQATLVYCIPAAMALLLLALESRNLQALGYRRLPPPMRPRYRRFQQHLDTYRHAPAWLLVALAIGLSLQASSAPAAVILGRCLVGAASFYLLVWLDQQLFRLSHIQDYALHYSLFNGMQNLGCLAAFSSAGFLAANQQYALPSLAAAAICLLLLGFYKPLSHLAKRQDSPTSSTHPS